MPAGLAGIVISQAAIQLSVRVMFATLPADFVPLVTIMPLPPDIRVIAFMLIAAFVSAVGFGLAPAIQATRVDALPAARGEFAGDVRPMRLCNSLVIGQVTVCVMLLACSGTLLRGADVLQHADVGFKVQNLIVVGVGEKFRAKIVDWLSSEPVIQAVAAAGSAPLNGMLPNVSVSSGEGKMVLRAWYNHVSPEYFPLLQIPIQQGRNFTIEEANSRAPVAVVSEAMARRLWPHHDAVGQEIRILYDAHTNWSEQVPQYQAVRVVGVAHDIVSCCIWYGKDPALIYFPVTPRAASGSLLIRVNGDAETAHRKLDAELSVWVPGGV
jgi:hypothetical protein